MVSDPTSCSSPLVPLDATPSRPRQVESTRSRKELSPTGDSDFRRELTEEERGVELTGGATTSEGSVDFTNQEKLSFSTTSSKTRKTGRGRFFLFVEHVLSCFLFFVFCCYFLCFYYWGVTRFVKSTCLWSAQWYRR